MILDADELALTDVREEAVFGRGHLLHACNIPLSRLELRLADLVPRRSVRIVLCDGGEGLAEKAAERLSHFGYDDPSVLEDGIQAWADAGYELFSGINVPSKAFGEFVEHQYSTPAITAQELKTKIDGGEDLVILDSRPLDEYRVMNIPGGVCVPGAELVYRVHDIAPSPSTLLVVNCAGRTRSIIGAQSLINAGIANKVVALWNGTMGWHLAGFELEHDMDRRAPAISPENLSKARATAAEVGKRFGVKTIDTATLDGWKRDIDKRALYLLDVRNPEEYEAGHLPGSRSAPGGQLVQATDRYVGILKSRIVLIDDTGVRATMTASWLNQMGWPDVAVLENALQGIELEKGLPKSSVLANDSNTIDELSPAELAQVTAGGVNIVDLSGSRNYKQRHIPGSWFALRSRLDADLDKLPSTPLIVLTSENGTLARIAAEEVTALTDTTVKVLAGGNAAWAAAGLPFAHGFENMASEPDDAWQRPYDRDSGAEDAMREYLSWEIDLVKQIERDRTARFGIV